MKTASIKPIIHGVVATALTICTTNAMERRDSTPTPREWVFVNLTSQDFEEEYIVDSHLENQRSPSDSESESASESDDSRGIKRKRTDSEDLDDGDTTYHLKKNYKPIICIGEQELNHTDTEADFENYHLTTLPDSIGKLVALSELLLSDNLLTTLPYNIGNLRALKKLYLTNNKLTTLPESVGKLGALKRLDLHGNKLTTLPDSIRYLDELKYLDLSCNNLGSLPASIGYLETLKELFLGSNNITTLPDSIGNLGALLTLEIVHNKLTNLPECIGNLESLKVLELNYNQLTTLPNSIGNLTALEYLDLAGNPLMGDEQQWSKLLQGNELDSFRDFYKIREILTMKIGGLLLLANHFDSTSILADIPSEIVEYISLLHIYDRLG